jgi:hypothetical protein
MLARTQTGQQDDFTTGKFERIMMLIGTVRVDTAKPRYPSDLSGDGIGSQRVIAFDVAIECELGAGRDADSDIRLSDRRKPSRSCVSEFGRHKLFAATGFAGQDVAQAEIAHAKLLVHLKSSPQKRPAVPSRSLQRPFTAAAAALCFGHALNFAASGALKNDAIRRVATQSRAAGGAARIALPKSQMGCTRLGGFGRAVFAANLEGNGRSLATEKGGFGPSRRRMRCRET